MNSLRTLYPFVRPYRRKSVIALVLLTSLVFMDLSIPRLLQRLIDQGINKQDGAVVLQTSIIMLLISAISTVFAIGNNYFSVQVGEGVARDMRETLFLKIQSFSYGNLDRFTTGKLLVRLTSDASAVQRLVQISLRIGTRAPLLMIGSLILMFVTDVHLAMMILPLLLADRRDHRHLQHADGAALSHGPAQARRAQHGAAGKHRRRTPGQGLCAQRP